MKPDLPEAWCLRDFQATAEEWFNHNALFHVFIILAVIFSYFARPTMSRDFERLPTEQGPSPISLVNAKEMTRHGTWKRFAQH